LKEARPKKPIDLNAVLLGTLETVPGKVTLSWTDPGALTFARAVSWIGGTRGGGGPAVTQSFDPVHTGTCLHGPFVQSNRHTQRAPATPDNVTSSSNTAAHASCAPAA
jgi:hypothetical protein